jgi:HTH-type transcriptional regulator / antitoxin MqsA
MSKLVPRKRQPHICMRCGREDVIVRHFGDVLDFKGLTLEVEGLAETACKNCGYQWTTDGQESDNLSILRAAFAEKRDEVRAAEGLLTGDQVRQALEDLKLSKTQAAELFGGGPNAFGKYISGDVLQSVAMDRLVRLTVAFGPSAVAVLKRGAAQPFVLCSAYFAMAATTGARTHSVTTTTSTVAPVAPVAATVQTASSVVAA